MSVHVSHFPDVPHFQASVVRHCVKLIILSVKANTSDGVSMADECLDLLLVVQVPDSDNSVLSSTHYVLAVGGDSQTEGLIEMALHAPVVFLALKYQLLLALQIPYTHSHINKIPSIYK